MFTSRAEFRLTLRADNADQRLTPKGIALGCVDAARAEAFARTMERLGAAREMLTAERFSPRDLAAAEIKVNQDGQRRSAFELLSYPEIGEADVLRLLPDFADVAPEIRAQIGREAVYANYLERQDRDASALRRDEAAAIPEGFDYGVLSGLSNELRLKLVRVKPATLAQAAKLEGMTPAALTLILAHLKRGDRRKSA
jgi:tRNA uridine 5-carboxymethylaminomethyl modification enzyme